MKYDNVISELTLGLEQADVYDATRRRLLRGREDMLALVAAQLEFKAKDNDCGHVKPTWVDVGVLQPCRVRQRLCHFLTKLLDWGWDWI